MTALIKIAWVVLALILTIAAWVAFLPGWLAPAMFYRMVISTPRQCPTRYLPRLACWASRVGVVELSEADAVGGLGFLLLAGTVACGVVQGWIPLWALVVQVVGAFLFLSWLLSHVAEFSIVLSRPGGRVPGVPKPKPPVEDVTSAPEGDVR